MQHCLRLVSVEVWLRDEYVVVKVGGFITCLNVKFLPTLLKYMWPDYGFLLVVTELFI